MHNLFNSPRKAGEKGWWGRNIEWLNIRKRWLSLLLLALMGQWNVYGDAYRGAIAGFIPHWQGTSIATTAGFVDGPQLREEFRPPSTPEPTAEPTPDVPRLRAGFQGYDKPEKDVGSSGDPTVVVKEVGGQDYSVVGAWQCAPVPPVKPYVQVHLIALNTDVWVLPGALDMTDEELKAAVNGTFQHQGQKCQ